MTALALPPLVTVALSVKVVSRVTVVLEAVGGATVRSALGASVTVIATMLQLLAAVASPEMAGNTGAVVDNGGGTGRR